MLRKRTRDSNGLGSQRRRYATIKCTRRAVLRIRYINERRVIRTLRSISSRLKVNPPPPLAGRRMSPLFSHLSEDFSERRPLPAVSCTDRSFSEKVPTVRCNTHNKLFFVSTCPPQIDRELCNTRCPQRVGRSSSGRGERCAYVRDTSETIILETFECRVLRVHVLAKTVVKRSSPKSYQHFSSNFGERYKSDENFQPHRASLNAFGGA
ncbi:hypothetical protein EVAR_3181_1 [Eumeta japonica]|uniref:Uncharacterized protein n=1 Tax=Eumeta variegata TaxID=151549 RepID=A0A4C1XJK2_EUMVA|nr:hypothetical protein EVAR_3181_1 [Eumeta japonica]